MLILRDLFSLPAAMATNPYLSVVVAARNDNYGGDFEQRLQNCIHWFVFYADRFSLSAEFIIVNYNPVPNRPSLAEQLQFPKSIYVQFRIITVPGSFHESISDERIRKKLPMYEYIAKNIGIRRASGEFILSANPDILIDPSIMKYMAEGKLHHNKYYRANRADYHYQSGAISPEKDLREIQTKVFRLFTKGQTHDFSPGGNFLLRIIRCEIKGFLFRTFQAWLVKNKWASYRFDISMITDNMSLKMHANCSGDFMLMGKGEWSLIKGHPQNTYLSIHTDALTVATAKFSGFKEYTFFYPVYHKDHERRFTADNSNVDIHAMFRNFEDDSRKMEKASKPIVYNGEEWGFVNEIFEEVRI